MLRKKLNLNTFYMLTFGCKVNQYETQAIRERWLACGLREADNPADADVALINSCAITAKAVSELRQTVRRLHREAPQLAIILAGCGVIQEAEEASVLVALPGVVALVTPDRKTDLLNVFELLDVERSDDQTVIVGKGKSQANNESASYPLFTVSDFRRSRPVLKVQDGCSQHCTYCIVPLARGDSRSRKPQDVVDEARRFLAVGFREIVLSGINLRQYTYRSEGCKDFWDLISLLERELADEWNGIARFRLSSVDPAQLNEHGLEVLARSRLLCPHIHLSIQSGSNTVLERMRRKHYTAEKIVRAVEALGTFWPRFGLGADLLTGFPGETEQEAHETLELVRLLPLTYGHVFPYSERAGTVAASLPHAVPVSLRKKRAALLRRSIDEKSRLFQKDIQGKQCVVALETKEHGVNEWYVPCRFTDSLTTDIIDKHRELFLGTVVDLDEQGVLVRADRPLVS